MTTSSPKSYNEMALRGGGFDDMEYVERFGLDPAVAYTPAINDAMLDIVQKENYDFYISEGETAEIAAAKAKENRTIAERNIKELLAKNGMLK